MSPREISQETEDALVTGVMTLAVEKGVFKEFQEHAGPEAMAEMEECAERHAARMRAKGEPGW